MSRSRLNNTETRPPPPKYNSATARPEPAMTRWWTCLAVAVFRARIMPVWVGIAVLLSFVGALFLPYGPTAFVADYLLFAGLFRFGLRAARTQGR